MWHTLKMEQTNSFWLIWILLRCARVLERIVNQNNYTDIALGKLFFSNYNHNTMFETSGSTRTKPMIFERLMKAHFFPSGSFSLRKSVEQFWENQLCLKISFLRLESWKWLPSAGTRLTTISLLSLLDLVKDIDDSFDTSIKHKIQRCNVHHGVYDYDVV